MGFMVIFSHLKGISNEGTYVPDGTIEQYYGDRRVMYNWAVLWRQKNYVELSSILETEELCTITQQHEDRRIMYNYGALCRQKNNVQIVILKAT